MITDLLDTGKNNLQVRYNENKIPFVNTLTIVECKTYEDACNVLTEGAKSRTVASTAMNARSSRSHSMFTLYIENLTKGRHAKFQFIDL